MRNEPLFLQFSNELEILYNLIIEEDYFTVYGYLIKGKEIVSDVWLYNTIDSPEYIDWENPELMPFPSPKGLAKSDSQIIRFDNEKLIKVKWEKQAMFNKICAKILYDDVLFAILIEDEFPGKSINARVDSRLANVLP